MEDKIINYLNDPYETIPEPQKGNFYTDEEIEVIYERISASRMNRTPLLIPKDKRIAIQLALGYIEERFHDRELMEYFIRIGVLTEENAKKISKKYIPVTEDELEERRKGAYVADVTKQTRADGQAAIAEIGEI